MQQKLEEQSGAPTPITVGLMGVVGTSEAGSIIPLPLPEALIVIQQGITGISHGDEG